MLILVQGTVSGRQFDGIYRAGRKWPSGSPVTVEVLDQAEDPPLVKQGDLMVADPRRIGRKSYEALKSDPRIRIIAEGGVSDALASEAVDSARTMATHYAQENIALRLEVEMLNKIVTHLRDRLREAGLNSDERYPEVAGFGDPDLPVQTPPNPPPFSLEEKAAPKKSKDSK